MNPPWGFPLTASAVTTVPRVTDQINVKSDSLNPITHEVAGHANRALEHHLERRLRTVAMFEAH